MITTTLHEVNVIAQEFDEKLENLSTERVFAILAMLNRLLYLAAYKEKIISPVNPKTGQRTYNRKNISKIAQPVTVVASVTGILTYFKDHWGSRVYGSINPVRKTRNLLCETFKLFTLEDRDWEDAKNRSNKPNPCSEFDAVRALILAERCEQKLLLNYGLEEIHLDWSQEIGNGNYPTVRDESKSMPEHKAYTLVALFNMMFDGIVQWGREVEPSVNQPLPDVVQIVNTNFKRLQAEQAFERFQEAEPDRPPEEILATETFDYTESEVVVSNGVSVLVDRLITRIPLAAMVRISMKVPPAERVKVEKEASVAVPVWAMDKTERAIGWWEEKLGKTELWLSEMAPSWVLDAVLPF